jgi:hypothetical protein
MILSELLAPYHDYVEAHDWDGLESAALEAEGPDIGESMLARVDAVDTAAYAEALRAAFERAVELARADGARWLRFVYRTADEWRGELTAGEEYLAMVAGDPDAGEHRLDAPVPSLPGYAEILRASKGLRADAVRALHVLLAARTVALFGRAVDATDTGGIVPCIMEDGAGPAIPIFASGLLDQPDDEAGDLVTVAAFSRPFEAQFAKARLEAHGIAAMIRDEYTVSMNWLWSNAIGGVKVQVAARDLDAARVILSVDATEDLGEEIESDPSFRCPACGSTHTDYVPRREPWYRLLWGAVILLLSLPAPASSNEMICRDCGHTWRVPEEK